MKKLLLATAVAALSVSAANAAPTVYGKAFLTVDYQHDKIDGEDSTNNTSLNSVGSKIGFKGAEALTANTDLVYQLEYGVNVDAGSQAKSTAKTVTTKEGEFVTEITDKKQDQFYSRDTYLGLSNKQYGTVLAGRLTAIDDMVNYANVTAGGVIGGDNVLATIDGPRADNAMAYVSPSYNGLNFLGMYAMDEIKDKNKSDKFAGLDNATGSVWGIGAQYEPAGQPVRAGATYMQSKDVKDIRVSGAYDLNAATTIGALYQNTDFGGKDDKKENAYTLSGTYKTATPWTVYGQADYVKNVAGGDGDDAQRYVVGGKYAFNAATTGHVYGAYLLDDPKGDNNNTKNYGIGTGIEYKF